MGEGELAQAGRRAAVAGTLGRPPAAGHRPGNSGVVPPVLGFAGPSRAQLDSQRSVTAMTTKTVLITGPTKESGSRRAQAAGAQLVTGGPARISSATRCGIISSRRLPRCTGPDGLIPRRARGNPTQPPTLPSAHTSAAVRATQSSAGFTRPATSIAFRAHQSTAAPSRPVNSPAPNAGLECAPPRPALRTMAILGCPRGFRTGNPRLIHAACATLHHCGRCGSDYISRKRSKHISGKITRESDHLPSGGRWWRGGRISGPGCGAIAAIGFMRTCARYGL